MVSDSAPTDRQPGVFACRCAHLHDLELRQHLSHHGNRIGDWLIAHNHCGDEKRRPTVMIGKSFRLGTELNRPGNSKAGLDSVSDESELFAGVDLDLKRDIGHARQTTARLEGTRGRVVGLE
jgi:hypothetical protein